MMERSDIAACWDTLAAELDAWSAAGAIATFWWRDDDATAPSANLERLLRTAPALPLALAVIPEPAEPDLARRIAGESRVTVLQHGFAHRNHAPARAKKSEYGRDRPATDMLRELSAGQSRLADLFDGAVRPVFVPPWNRIDTEFAGRLDDLGFAAVSTFGTARDSARPRRINAHVDIIDWSRTRRFSGEAASLRPIVAHLAARRTGEARPSEATGLMTHHLDHDEDAWDFLDRLFATTAGHPAVRWVDVDTLLERTP